jgi:hypothetical protein
MIGSRENKTTFTYAFEDFDKYMTSKAEAIVSEICSDQCFEAIELTAPEEVSSLEAIETFYSSSTASRKFNIELSQELTWRGSFEAATLKASVLWMGQ